MLTFRTRRSFSGKNNYLGHDFQRKLVWLAMILIIGTILVGQSTGRLPTFERLLGRDGAGEDNRVAATEALTDPNSKVDAQAAVTDGALKPVATKKLFGNAEPGWFLGLQDDAVYRIDEQTAFFSLLKLLSESDESDIRLASTGTRTYRQLSKQADDYRGEIVTIKGKISRLIPVSKLPPNKQGVEKYYEVWIEPDGSRLPMVAVCAELPADFPANGTEGIWTEVTGFFYKRLGYASKEIDASNRTADSEVNVFRSAPLVIAKTLAWRRDAAPAENVEAEIGPRLPLGIPQKYVFHVIGAGVLVMIMVAFWSYRLSRTSVLAHGPLIGRRRREAEADPEPTDLNNLRF